MTPRTLKLNAHRSLTYYTPEDVATLQHELSIARQNAELLTGYWKAAVAEVKALRGQMRSAAMLAAANKENSND